MFNKRLFLIFLASCLVSAIGLSASAQQQQRRQADGPVKVEIQFSGDSWQLLRSGEPYRIRGAGGDASMALLAECGANSGRTWGAEEKIRKQLDEAHRNGLSVAVGIWLEHPSQKFNYNDFDDVSAQIENVLESVRRFKNHPAVLVWGIGNEMEGAGDDPAIWSHIEHLARLVKAEDPNHPTMTVIAEMGGRKIEALHRLCPSIDIVGINSYGGLMTLAERYRKLGGTKPYIVTEFGPVGSWEVPKNPLESIDEPTSTEKAEIYRRHFSKIEEDTELCLGSYAFLWGNKQEATATWFGLLLSDGSKTAPVDVLTELWSGAPPENRCPDIQPLSVADSVVEPGTTISVSCSASDPDNDPLSYRWTLMAEADSYATGGFLQATPDQFNDRISSPEKSSTQVSLPETPGLYRIYVVANDGRQAVATANTVVRVYDGGLEAWENPPGASTVVAESELPFRVFDEAQNDGPWVASGWMGNTEALKMKFDCVDNPSNGANCIQCDYESGNDWAGVVWQHPADDWGDLDGGVDLSAATKLTFRARGAAGGEEVKFGVGIIKRGKPFFDSVRKEVLVTLSDEWQTFTIDLSDSSRARVKSAFWFSVAGQTDPLRFYLDEIEFCGP